MEKNRVIKENLEYHLSNSKKLFQGQFSFPNIVQQELDNFDNIKWLPSTEFDIDSVKERNKKELLELLNDNQLHLEIENVLGKLIDIKKKTIQEYLENQLINNLSEIAQNIHEENKELKLNLLFLEHNYDSEACFCGFDDPSYKYKLLSGQEYLECDYKKELFNGIGRFDYTTILSPYLEFEKEIGEEKVELINDVLFGGMYLEEIKKLFLLNGFLGIHVCLSRIKDKIKQISIPMRDEVFIFVNEHDCEQLNIYVL